MERGRLVQGSSEADRPMWSWKVRQLRTAQWWNETDTCATPLSEWELPLYRCEFDMGTDVSSTTTPMRAEMAEDTALSS